jgi:hypothetical protein
MRNLGWLTLHYVARFYDPKLPVLALGNLDFDYLLEGVAMDAIFGIDNAEVGHPVVLETVSVQTGIDSTEVFVVNITKGISISANPPQYFKWQTTDGPITSLSGQIFYGKFTTLRTLGPVVTLYSTLESAYSESNPITWADTYPGPTIVTTGVMQFYGYTYNI